jgi:hypothetical protein
MVVTEIRKRIDVARRQELGTGQLAERLQQELPQLRAKLILPEENPLAALLDFITDYIENVPSCLQLVAASSKELGFYDYAAPFLDMAEQYFLRPPAGLAEGGSMEALLDEAFLAHRLLEEINDHHIRHLHRPLLPLDMTEANIIVHHLLGDELANKLDNLVEQAAAQLLNKDYAWAQLKSLPGGESTSLPVLGDSYLARSPKQVRLRLARQVPGP